MAANILRFVVYGPLIIAPCVSVLISVLICDWRGESGFPQATSCLINIGPVQDLANDIVTLALLSLFAAGLPILMYLVLIIFPTEFAARKLKVERTES
jgi:hypothetical protein